MNKDQRNKNKYIFIYEQQMETTSFENVFQILCKIIPIAILKISTEV